MTLIEGHLLEDDVERTCDVAIVGSGAGGSVLAARLAARGLEVVVLEEGGAHGRQDFKRPDETWSYPNLYQERGGRATADLAITILQGRAVGGTTVVNWTTCFRTPERILAHWRREHGLTLTADALAPHFEAVEDRLSIATWPAEVANPNNRILQRGCEALGHEWGSLRRNVKGCADSGLCGLGCPVDGKQAMHITYLADAQRTGAVVFSDVRVVRLEREGRRVVAVHGVTMQRGADRPAGRRVVLRPKVTVVSGGAINTPGLLLRSGFEHPMIGRRTFLHPVIAVLARYDERIEPFRGAPQSIGSHAFIERGDEMGYFLEVPPLQPMLTASAGWTSGPELMGLMRDLPHVSGIIALHVDGLHPEDGGTVSLRSDGRIRVDYPVHDRLVRAFRDSHEQVARIHLAAGAREVVTTHAPAQFLRSVDDLPGLRARAFGAHAHGIFTAHQMGGCAMGEDPARHVVDRGLAVRDHDDLFIVDGSVLPTSLGVNPSETIYGIAHWASEGIAARV